VQNLVPAFLFEEDFDYKVVAKKKKVVKIKEVKKDDSIAGDSSTDSEEEEEEEEETSEEDLSECVVLEEGKYKLNEVFMKKVA